LTQFLFTTQILNIEELVLYFVSDYVNVNPNDMFIWMPKEHMCVLVYLVSSLIIHVFMIIIMDLDLF
jgi:hypothetical protein